MDGWEKRPRYATLSHCWGNIDFIRLKQELTEFFIIAIPLKNLTKTFRDPLEITQDLGLDYLWIDSLCIIQNSDFDWEKASGMMVQFMAAQRSTMQHQELSMAIRAALSNLENSWERFTLRQ